jgi:hypothetical protein
MKVYGISFTIQNYCSNFSWIVHAEVDVGLNCLRPVLS